MRFVDLSLRHQVNHRPADRLRTAKRRYREARLAFWPELAEQCKEAGVPLPREAAEALVVMKNEVE